LTEFEIALVLLSALLHAGWSVSIKSSPDPLAFNLVQAWFAPVVGLALLPWIDFGALPRSLLAWSAASGIAHAVYFYWLTRAFEQGDMSLVYPISRSAPAFVPLVAVPLLGESLSLGGAAGIAVVVLGMWAVYGSGQLDRTAVLAPGTRFALLTLAASVAYSLLDKRGMSQLAELPWTSPVPRAVVFYLLLHFTLVLVFTPMVLRKRSLPALLSAVRQELVRGTAASVVSFVGYGLILAALATAPVSYVVAVRQTSVLFAVALSVVWLRERPGPLRVLGAVATVVGVALIARFS
jgi:drug/metabolite transporter (DMT)-like permease